MPAQEHKRPRVCLFGGTFDPIHCAHLKIAEEALSRFELDRILFIPAGSPPHKTAVGLTPYEDRFRMVEIACQPFPAFEASRLEASEHRSYTIETIRRFKESVSTDTDVYFLIGADAFDEIETWKDWQTLLGEIEFLVVTRPGKAYSIPPGARLQKLDGLAIPVSSSAIRRRLALHEPTPELPPAVRAFIEARGLYGFGQQTQTPATVLP